MADLRTRIAKEFSNLPRPKISKPYVLDFQPPELRDETKEIGIGWKIGTFLEEARIQQPMYDVASDLIPMKSNTTTIDVNPSSLMKLDNIEVDFQPISISIIDSQISSLIKIFPVPFAELTLDKLSIFGMNYADKHWRKIAILKDDNIPQLKEKSRDQKREGDFVEPKKRGRKTNAARKNERKRSLFKGTTCIEELAENHQLLVTLGLEPL